MSFYDALFPDYKSNNKCNRTNFFPRGFSLLNCPMKNISHKLMPWFCPFNGLKSSLNIAVWYRKTVLRLKVGRGGGVVFVIFVVVLVHIHLAFNE